MVGLGIAHVGDAHDGVLRGGGDDFEVFGIEREKLQVGHRIRSGDVGSVALIWALRLPIYKFGA